MTLRAKTIPIRLALALIMTATGIGDWRQAMAQPTQANTSRAQPNTALATAPSPYLRAHADDLVRWRTWGKEAFAEARRLRKPVFLSIGYLACYWCGVMKRESFSHPRVAALLNDDFIPILVDREAQPDIDALHLAITRMELGVAGWPNNLFLLPDGRAFMARGYMPREEFLRVLREVRDAWRADPGRLRRKAQDIAERLAERRQRVRTRQPLRETVSETAFRRATLALVARHDPFFGGLDAIPKHFRQPQLMLLARAALAHDLRQARDMLLLTLRTISRAGVFDHLGGGFFRYAVDPAWNEPHFEKMLNDQALLTEALLAGWRLGGGEELKATALATLEFVERELTLPGGGLASSLSASDRRGREGGFYLWTREELHRLLPARDAALALEVFETYAEGALAGMVHVHMQHVAGLDSARRQRLERILDTLRRQRASRESPARDEKAITAWNGMMVAALARAGMQWRQEKLLQRARRTARFLLRAVRLEDGSLARYWLEGRARGRATLADYAHMIDALLALHDADPDGSWLREARRLANEARERLLNDEGRWRFAQGTGEVARMPPPADGAQPAADAFLALALARLAARGGGAQWRELAQETLAMLAGSDDVARQATVLRAADILLRGDDGLVRWAADGRLRALARWDDDARAGGDARRGRVARIVVNVARGWHVQSAQPDDPNLIATSVMLRAPAGARLTELSYPAPVRRRLAFSQAPLKLYKGTFVLRGRVMDLPPGSPARLGLRVQACSDTICLPPEELTLTLPPPEEPSVDATTRPPR